MKVFVLESGWAGHFSIKAVFSSREAFYATRINPLKVLKYQRVSDTEEMYAFENETMYLTEVEMIS